MKEIITKKYADLVTHPPIDKEKDENTIEKDKKKKKLPQLGICVEDISINDVAE